MATATTDDPLVALGHRILGFPGEKRRAILAAMPPSDLVVVERAIALVAGEGWRATPLNFGIRLGLLQDMPHTRLLSEAFRRAVSGEEPRQIWNMPSRVGKSTMGSRTGPAWAMETYPDIKLALTSFGDSLSSENAGAVRDILRDNAGLLTTKLRRDRQKRDRFLTEQGGGLIAAGIGGTLTGFGAHGIVVDDPFKNWQEAHSEARRLLVWNWYRSVVRMRLENRGDVPGFIIVVMTRWHEEDLTGKLLDSEGGDEWTLYRLPAIAEEHDPTSDDRLRREPDRLGRKPGEPLAPELFSLDDWIARARDAGSYLTSGMEQQRPTPEEGSDLMRSWWRWYTELPPAFDDALTSWDMKLKDKESGDYVVGQAWGRTGTTLWGIDQLRGQYNEPTTRAAIALMQVRHPHIRKHIIENTGNGPEVIEVLSAPQPGYKLSEATIGMLGMTVAEVPQVEALLHRGMTGILPESPQGSKPVRARTYSPLVEAGNCRLPEGAAWADAFVTEAAVFPEGAHDDMVDAWSQAMKRLSKAPIAMPVSSAAMAQKIAPASPLVQGDSAQGMIGPVPTPVVPPPVEPERTQEVDTDEAELMRQLMLGR